MERNFATTDRSIRLIVYLNSKVMIYELWLNGFLWYVDKDKKIISEDVNLSNGVDIKQHCTQHEQETIIRKIAYGEAKLIEQVD